MTSAAILDDAAAPRTRCVELQDFSGPLAALARHSGERVPQWR